MHVYLVHHGDAIDAALDARRPLSSGGREAVDRLARATAAHGARPSIVWHSGKLRARQTAEAFWRECNALAAFSATKDLQPDDPPSWMRDRLRHEPRDILIAGHFPHLPRLLTLLLEGSTESPAGFPPHGVVALCTEDDGHSWQEVWRMP
ncbi:MAG: phosphohistidine phosphatase SixA [Luteitalea sp.]|nr:phosphohistidine phosphatase SixA [Luteitalea sp.]